MRSIPALAFLSSLLAFGPLATAQVTPVAGTGCGGVQQTQVTGSPQLGQQIVVQNQFPCTRSGPGALGIVGVGVMSTATVIPGCSGRTCTIGVLPTALAVTPLSAQVSISIPNLPNLVGFCVYAQSACLSVFGLCVDADVAVQICVQP